MQLLTKLVLVLGPIMQTGGTDAGSHVGSWRSTQLL
jgi:hypothetical protein